MALKLTARFLGDEKRPASKKAMPKGGADQVDHRDSLAPGLIARVSKSGRCSFAVWYRFNGKARRDTLRPAYPALSLEAARDEARATAADVAAGRDPRRSDRAPRRHYLPDVEPEVQRQPQTYREAVTDYVKRHQRGQENNRTAGEVERALLRAGGLRRDPKTGDELPVVWPKWLGLPVAEITVRDIRQVLEAIRDGRDGETPAPYMSNRTYAYMKTFFAWCAEPGIELVDASPMIGLRKPWSGEKSRDRWYTDDEIAALWKAADGLSVQAGALVKMLILTGKRKGAVAAMKWPEIDDDGMWTPPQDRRRKRGNKRLHPIPLPELARRIIKSLPKVDGSDYVFPGRLDGQHLKPGNRLQDTLKEKAGIRDFMFHALRHTLETRLAELGIQPHVADLLLDHAPARGAGAGYNHYLYRREMADALETWAEHVATVLRRKKVWRDNVEPMRG